MDQAAVTTDGAASATITPAQNGAKILRNGISLKCTSHSIRLTKDSKIIERSQQPWLPAGRQNCPVISFELAFADVIQLSFDEPSAQGTEPVRKQHPVKMIIFMKDHPGFVSLIYFIVEVPLHIVILYAYLRLTENLLV